MPARILVNVGDQFGKWTVVHVLGRIPGRSHRQALCQCICGRQAAVAVTCLHRGLSSSCRTCTRKAFRHGHATPRAWTRTYRAWIAMRTRCLNPAEKSWKHYGGRGITICQRWDRFEAFLEDMGPHPGKGYSLDRIDNEQGYAPDNCRWATPREQARNCRRNTLLTLHGVTRPLCVWEEITGITRQAIYRRIKTGWTVEEALTTPLRVSRLLS